MGYIEKDLKMKPEITIEYMAKIADKNWPHFLWFVSVGDETFNYKTGLGHFTSQLDKLGKNVKKPENSLIISELNGWVHIPKIDEVMCSLFGDAQAAEESFDSFCDNFGYSNDSLKALDTYRACAETVVKLKKAFGPSYYSEKNRYMEMDL